MENYLLIENLACWIKERELIRLRRELGQPKPWSTDPVFQTTYFCNVHREDDKVTKWIRKNWCTPAHVDQPTFEASICMARLLNWPPSLELIGFPWWSAGWTPAGVCDLLRQRAAEGRKIWGNAYVVTTHGQKVSKLDYLQDLMEEMLIRTMEMHATLRQAGTLAVAHRYLMKFEGFGSFMAAQVVADLKNSEGHPLQYAKDWWNWSALGPGSLRGLQWVTGRRITPGTYEEVMKDLHVEVEKLVYPIHMCEQDLQNCLCEFDKYMRVRTGTGRSKRKYHGEK